MGPHICMLSPSDEFLALFLRVLLSLLLANSHSITHSFGFVVDEIPSLSKRESTYKRLKLNVCRITLSLTKWAKAWSNAINDNEETLDFATEAYMVNINHLRRNFLRMKQLWTTCRQKSKIICIRLRMRG